MYCEIGIKFKKIEDEQFAARFLVNVYRKIIMFCPLHYRAYMVPDSPTTGTVRDYMVQVIFASDLECDAFFNQIK